MKYFTTFVTGGDFGAPKVVLTERFIAESVEDLDEWVSHLAPDAATALRNHAAAHLAWQKVEGLT